MESKTVILGVLIMSLVMAENQVEAWSCCPTIIAKNTYNTCRLIGAGTEYCARTSNCQIVSGNTCPPEFPYIVDGNYGDAVNEYCKLGCASSMCGALISSDASEIVNGVVAQCTSACSNFCTKGSANAVEAA